MMFLCLLLGSARRGELCSGLPGDLALPPSGAEDEVRERVGPPGLELVFKAFLMPSLLLEGSLLEEAG